VVVAAYLGDTDFETDEEEHSRVVASGDGS
jgi:hypothetical protein